MTKHNMALVVSKYMIKNKTSGIFVHKIPILSRTGIAKLEKY